MNKKMTDDLHRDYGTIYRPFGPMIYQQEISQQLYDDLMQSGEQSTDNMKHTVSELNDERDITRIISEESKEEIFDRCALYMAGLVKKPPEHQKRIREKYSLDIDGIWINYMKSHEYFPPHVHKGDISFVIYLDNPIKEEGKIQFRYGERHDMSDSMFQFTPQTKHMLIFPAWLEHQVFKFTKDVTRISVAGNIHINIRKHNATKDE